MDQLWVDKYRPKTLDEYIFNLPAINKLKKLANNSADLPHLIIEGVSGIGKKSVTMSFIRECVDQYGLNGSSVYKTQNYDISLKYPNKSIDLNIQKSHYHYNLNPSDYGIYDRHIVQDFLKMQFQYKAMTNFPYQTVIIRNSENLSLDAQQSLRRTLENYIKNCRFIFVVNSEKQGNLIPALKSRCIRIKMSSPTQEEALAVVTNILDHENLKVHEEVIFNLYKKCHGNLTKAINLLQLHIIKNGSSSKPITEIIKLPEVCQVTRYCQEIVIKMFQNNHMNSITEIRNLLYSLLTHGVNSEEIVKKIFRLVLNNLPGWEKEIVQITDTIEMQLQKSSREFYHLENYVIQLIFLVKQYQAKHPNHSLKTKEPTPSKTTKSKTSTKTATKSTTKPIPLTSTTQPKPTTPTTPTTPEDSPKTTATKKETKSTTQNPEVRQITSYIPPKSTPVEETETKKTLTFKKKLTLKKRTGNEN